MVSLFVVFIALSVLLMLLMLLSWLLLLLGCCCVVVVIGGVDGYVIVSGFFGVVSVVCVAVTVRLIACADIVIPFCVPAPVVCCYCIIVVAFGVVSVCCVDYVANIVGIDVVVGCVRDVVVALVRHVSLLLLLLLVLLLLPLLLLCDWLFLSLFMLLRFVLVRTNNNIMIAITNIIIYPTTPTKC